MVPLEDTLIAREFAQGVVEGERSCHALARLLECLLAAASQLHPQQALDLHPLPLHGGEELLITGVVRRRLNDGLGGTASRPLHPRAPTTAPLRESEFECSRSGAEGARRSCWDAVVSIAARVVPRELAKRFSPLLEIRLDLDEPARAAHVGEGGERLRRQHLELRNK